MSVYNLAALRRELAPFTVTWTLVLVVVIVATTTLQSDRFHLSQSDTVDADALHYAEQRHKVKESGKTTRHFHGWLWAETDVPLTNRIIYAGR